MSKLIQAKIDVMKIVKSKLFTGKSGTYLDLIIWINDQPDQYGNTVSIEQKTAKGEQKIYLGNGKEYKPQQPAQAQQQPDQIPTTASAEVDGLPF